MPFNIRPATLSDQIEMAQLTAAGFLDDDVYGNYQHPHRKEYYDDWTFYWQKALRTHIVEKNQRVFVGVDEQSGRIAGVIVWERMGEGAAKLPDSLPLRLQRAYVTAQNLATSYLFPDRSANPEHMANFDQNWDLICHHWICSRSETWYIHYLCIHPDFQYMGLGPKMANIGIEFAKEEGISASVISSATGEPFYRKWGFEEVGQAVVGPLKDANLKGGSIKFYERHLQK